MKILNLAFRRLAPLALLALALGGCVTSEAVSSYNKGVEARNLDTKITHYTKAIAADPNFARAYNNRGNAYNRKGLYDKALADLTKAIELAPEDPAALVNRGIAYKNKGQFDRAIEDYDDAIHFKPDMVQAYGNRGNAFSLKGLYDKAINDQTKSIALAEAGGNDRGLTLGYLNRGDAHQSKGSYNLTIQDVNEVLELFPNMAHARAHLAWVLATAPDEVFRDGKRAVAEAEKAAGLERNAFNLEVLAAAYAETGRFGDAIETLSDVNALLRKRGGEGSLVVFEKHLMRYQARKPWRMSQPADGPDYTTAVIKLNARAKRLRAGGKHEEAERLESQALVTGKQARRREEAEKRQRRQIEALSGRYTTAGGRSHWDISIKEDRFEAHYIGKTGRRTLFYDGTVTGTEIIGREYHFDTTICRKSKRTPLKGHVDLDRGSIKKFTEGFDIVERRKNKRCVPENDQTEWLQKNRQ